MSDVISTSTIESKSHIVCYIDVLGLSKMLKSKPEVAYQQIDFLRKSLFEWFDKFYDTAKVRPRIEVFSDSILMYIEDGCPQMPALIDAMLAALVCTFTASLNFDPMFTFRGGVEIGEAKIIGEKDYRGITGPVLVKLNEIESKVAFYPRVIVGKQLLSAIKQFDAIANKPKTLRWITKDMDGVDQLDVFCQEHYDLLMSGWDQRKVEAFFKDICKKLTRAYVEQEQSDNIRISSKWGYLLQYLRQSAIGRKCLKDCW
jgi:hypothetical protein